MQKVKNVLVVAVAVVLSCTTIAAQNCNYEKNIIDPITETPVKITQPITLAKLNNNPLYFKAQSIGIKYRFLKMRYYRYNGFSINEEREIAFRLNTDEEIVLHPRRTAADTIKSNVEKVSSMLVYPITAEQYEKLRRYPVTVFKYYITTGFVEIPIKENRQTKIIDILNCID